MTDKKNLKYVCDLCKIIHNEKQDCNKCGSLTNEIYINLLNNIKGNKEEMK